MTSIQPGCVCVSLWCIIICKIVHLWYNFQKFCPFPKCSHLILNLAIPIASQASLTMSFRHNAKNEWKEKRMKKWVLRHGQILKWKSFVLISLHVSQQLSFSFSFFLPLKHLQGFRWMDNQRWRFAKQGPCLFHESSLLLWLSMATTCTRRYRLQTDRHRDRHRDRQTDRQRERDSHRDSHRGANDGGTICGSVLHFCPSVCVCAAMS